MAPDRHTRRQNQSDAPKGIAARLWAAARYSLWPAHCVACQQRPIASFALPLCDLCKRSCPPAQRPFALGFCTAPLAYAGPVRAVVQAACDGQWARAWPALAEAVAMAPLARAWLHWAQWLVFVPADPKRLLARGVEPTALLARYLARAARRPCVGALARTSQSPAGRGSTRLSRAHSPPSFVVAPRAGRLPARIVLVDTVVHSGATLLAARAALQNRGAVFVRALLVAAAPPP